ncbi:MAG: ATP-binding cassette domain-containing protein [Robiginitomaculum sp.]|nr:ATP-binding cassette domain-containing protein [Robiginitomaculum sp.]
MSHVGLRYGNGPEVLRDINLTLHQGSLQFLTGPSGAGKTTLLKLIYLALHPSRGFVQLFGQDTSLASRDDLAYLRRKIGVVFQGFGLLDHLSVFENVALPLRVTGREHQDYQADVKDLLSWVGLGKVLDVSPATLSGGEKQRVAIARAVVAKPELLIADEPTGNVDPEMGKRLMRLFLELNRLGSTVLIASHDTNLIQAVIADIYSLTDGALSFLPARKKKKPK